MNTGARSSRDEPLLASEEIVVYTNNPYPKVLPGPRRRPEVGPLILDHVPNVSDPPKRNVSLKTEGAMSADQRLDAKAQASSASQRPQSGSQEKRKSAGSGVRPIQDRARPRTPRIDPRPVTHEIFSSDPEPEETEGQEFQMVSP